MTTHKREKNIDMTIIGLVILNVLLGVYIGFFKRDAVWLETLKAGGSENMTMAEQLYNSPAYIQQQKSTLDQILGSMNDQQVPTTNTETEVQPIVAE